MLLLLTGPPAAVHQFIRPSLHLTLTCPDPVRKQYFDRSLEEEHAPLDLDLPANPLLAASLSPNLTWLQAWGALDSRSGSSAEVTWLSFLNAKSNGKPYVNAFISFVKLRVV